MQNFDHFCSERHREGQISCNVRTKKTPTSGTEKMFIVFTKGEIIMNNIYKVIWSKAKNCYVVASEIARSHTKSATGSEKIGGGD